MKQIIILLSLISIFIYSCEKKKPSVAPSGLISHHTSGQISKESAIKIIFHENMVNEFDVGKQLDDSPFTFDPHIEGKVEWLNQRQLIFQPESKLKSGEDYLATLHLEKIAEILDGKGEFTFQFSVIKQNFSIHIDGLQSESETEIISQILTGDLITADAENGIDIENIIKCNQNSEQLPVTWRHFPDRRKHKFTINNIKRVEAESAVIIAWDGTVISVDNTGKREVRVPAIGSFELTDARAIQDKTEYVEITFSDPLLQSQNLNGLVTTPLPERLRYEIIRNQIKIFNTGKWSGDVEITVNPAIKNLMGYKLGKSKKLTVSFEDKKPQVRFSGKGVIIPSDTEAKIAIEVVNLNSIIVEAMHIYDKNIPQFLQVNSLDGDYELRRVGNVVWSDTISLNFTPDKVNQWIRYGLDLNPLISNHPKGMYRLKIYFNKDHIVYDCSESEDEDSDEESRRRRWSSYYHNRNNPCHPAYYQNYYDHKIEVTRNVLISDLGLLAKKGDDDRLFVMATDLKSALPLIGVNIQVFNYQEYEINRGVTDGNGIVTLKSKEDPFLIIAQKGDQYGYLKIDDGSALSVSHFDVSGQKLSDGLKGFIYGERGVWRPGDDIFLTFILFDPQNKIPDNHPAKLDLINARGQHVKTIIKNESLNGFYDFQFKTNQDDPTGNWQVKIRVGGAEFVKNLKIETIAPNRLDIDLDFGDQKILSHGQIKGKIHAKWLHGATAGNLKSDIEVGLKSDKTVFPDYRNFIFDDPARKYYPETFSIFDGTLDAKGNRNFRKDIYTRNTSPGMLRASFSTRVFEAGGAFSIEQFSMPYHPYSQYVGIYLPGSKNRYDRLSADSTYSVQLALVNQNGEPVKSGKVEIRVYKIQWRWWWERGRQSIADYVESAQYDPVLSEEINIVNGQAIWRLKIAGPTWGRYLIRARDVENGHQTGKIVSAYSRGWWGRDQDAGSEGITVLNLTTDKKEYTVGEKVALTIPTGTSGRGLISIESGTGILETFQIEGQGQPVQFELETTNQMVPNVFISVSYWQPHENINNDLPIRMYGVVPIKVFDPLTRLSPEISVSDILEPESKADFRISEKNGLPMTYTVALVDEGLLNLTNFSTPDPWNHFYQKEALGVKTWDLYNYVSGAYGAAWNQLLAIGGGDEVVKQGQKKADRFPPMVTFFGPFMLEKGGSNNHEFNIPQYVGSVKMMLVAANNNAFGSSEKTVKIRKPLMVLGTLPRVISPEENVDLPVAVFVLDENITDVTTSVKVEGDLHITGPSEKRAFFQEMGDKIELFKLRAGEKTGIAKVMMHAIGGKEEANHEIEIDIRQPNFPVTDVHSTTLMEGEDWQKEIVFPGVTGTNSGIIEISRIPPLNLGQRLGFLIRYPHGCVEQTTSAAFPQLYIARILKLSDKKLKQTEKNVKYAIDKLRSFQNANGGFGYWPGHVNAHSWSSNYAGHFLVEAKNMGYAVPALMIDRWIRYQKNQALSWVTGPGRELLVQSYRLYTLALAGKPELGAMNRLREEEKLPNTVKWRLAAAYYLAGQQSAAEEIASTATMQVKEYRELSYTYGSGLRDKSMILEALSIMGKIPESVDLVTDISKQLCSLKWLSTQTTAYALIAMARYAGISSGDMKMKFSYEWTNESESAIESSDAIYQQELTVNELLNGKIEINNQGGTVIYPRVIMTGIPRMGSETAGQNGIALSAKYFSFTGNPINSDNFEQGSDFIVEVKVKNTGSQGKYEELALSHLIPSGFEIKNTRMSDVNRTKSSSFDYQDIRDDRIYTYFDLKPGETKTFQVALNATYAGKFYLPMIAIEAMYDATINARIPGKWINVIQPGTK